MSKKIKIARLKTILFGIILILIGGGSIWYIITDLIPTLTTELFLMSLPPAKTTELIEVKNGDAVTITARWVKQRLAGQDYALLAYNDSVPGPLFKVKQNSVFKLTLQNNFDAPTMLHPHGLRVKNAFDGTHLTQPEIKPGEAFSYELRFPDVGMYWYHTHLDEARQQELGLYGNIWVTPEDESYWPPVNQEVPLILDDLLIGPEGIPFGQEVDRTLMGRFGNTLLVNGQTSLNLQAKKGEVVRFYLTNVANVRPFKMTIPGLKLKLIGGDNSAYEQETFVDEVTIAPSERYIVDVFFEQAGTFKLMHTHPDKQYTLGAITVSNDAVAVSYEQEFQSLRRHPLVSAEMAPYRAYLNQEPDKLLTIAVETQKLMDDLHHSGNIFNIPCHQMSDGQWMGNCTEADMHTHEEPLPIEWEDTMDAMNSISNKENVTWQLLDQQTGQINEQVKWRFKVGDKVKIRIFNDPESEHPMQHPIHFHGQSFLVLARNGQANDTLVWKDTVLIPTGETVDVLLHVTNPGQWMAHCHISEHFEDGMMLEYEVTGEDLASF